MLRPRSTPQAALATGSLASRPLAHLLVYALGQKLTGTFELAEETGERAQIVVASGLVSRVSTSSPVIYLGHLLYETGVIDGTQLSKSLAEVATTKRLHGQVLVGLGMVFRAQLAAALADQRSRKLLHAFALSPRTSFAFYTGVDMVGERPDDPAPADPLPTIWRGIQAHPSWEHVRSTIATVGERPLRLVGVVDRLGLEPAHRAAIERLRKTPRAVSELAASLRPDARLADLLAYFLVISRLAEVAARVDTEAATTTPTRKVSDAAVGAAPVLRSGEYIRKISFAMRAVGEDASAMRIPSPMPGPLTGVRPSRVPPPVPERPQPPCAVSEESMITAHHLVSEAEMHFVLGERVRAVGIVRQALAVAPSLPAAMALLAYLEALGTRKGQESYLRDLLRMVDTALVKDDRCKRGRLARAEIKKRLGDHEGAIRDLRAALRNDPDDADAGHELAVYERKVRDGTVLIRSAPEQGGTERPSGIVDWLRGKKPSE